MIVRDSLCGAGSYSSNSTGEAHATDETISSKNKRLRREERTKHPVDKVQRAGDIIIEHKYRETREKGSLACTSQFVVPHTYGVYHQNISCLRAPLERRPRQVTLQHPSMRRRNRRWSQQLW